MRFAKRKMVILILSLGLESCGTETTTTSTTAAPSTTTNSNKGIELPGFDYGKSGYKKPNDAVISCSSTSCKTSFTIDLACKVASVIVMEVKNNVYRSGSITTEFIAVFVGNKQTFDVPISKSSIQCELFL